ncbi:hypothetical protein HNQ59_000249 [Chitinivorax tropicus]|uniref:PilZ domain-containing protein n=1 Tax=Chitinivorax tropicus TaxID=714531 RepID=A0A840MJJ6_9PROT|nr:PilZ domain-containing protein [Chitinivorax tropicus]MBB5016987.1 hypothetical protein [Chitinivorax tropicus]
MRQFIRHPSSIPIEVHHSEATQQQAANAVNVSLGGLSFVSATAANQGDLIRVRIPGTRPPFETSAQVVWCRGDPPGFELGVTFLDEEDAFRVRMVEQVCQIEQYLQYVKQHEGRELSPEQAAREWIDKFAADFPNGGPESLH